MERGATAIAGERGVQLRELPLDGGPQGLGIGNRDRCRLEPRLERGALALQRLEPSAQLGQVGHLPGQGDEPLDLRRGIGQALAELRRLSAALPLSDQIDGPVDHVERVLGEEDLLPDRAQHARLELGRRDALLVGLVLGELEGGAPSR